MMLVDDLAEMVNRPGISGRDVVKLVTGVREDRILQAISEGVCTSAALALRLRIKRNLMSVTLYHMAKRGLVIRGGVMPLATGNRSIRWKIGPALEAAE